LAYLMIKQGDKVGLTQFSDRIDFHVPPGGTFSHLYKILNVLERCLPGNKTSIAGVLRRSFGMFRRRGLLVVISDFLDDPDEIFKALNLYIHRRFEIILFHVFHQFEIDLPPVPSANFIDAETGELLTCLPADIKSSYDTKLGEYLEKMSSLSRARGIDYNFISTQTEYQSALQKYLMRRNAI